MLRRKRGGDLQIDWSDIVDEWDLDISPETLRRAAIGVELAFDSYSKPDTSEDVSEDYIQRQKLRDMTNRLNRTYRAEARRGLLKETVEAAASRMKPYEIRRIASAKRDCTSELVIALGDIHYGSEFCLEGLNGEVLNQFNNEVYQQRMDKLASKVVHLIEQHSARKVHLLLVGDLLDGMLRTSQLMSLEYGIVESTMKLAEHLAGWIASLAQYTDINVHAVTGNHSEIRPLKSKHRDFEDENMERIIMWYMCERLRNTRGVTVDASCKRMNKVEILGKSFLLMHGDGEQSIENIARDSVNLYGVPIDYVVCGHLHRDESMINGVTNSGNSVVIRVPSLCGMNKYAQKKGYGGHPGALGIVLTDNDSQYCVYHIDLK